MSSSGDVAIRASGLSKAYLLWDDPRDRLRQPVRDRMTRWFHAAPKQYYKHFWALHGLSFELGRCETLGIIGRNGCGKSTMLQILAGTLTPTEGEVQVNGRVSALLELGSGFNPEFTGHDNVYMNAAILGLSKAEIDERYGRIVEFADIGEFIDQPVKHYSSGMFMRLAFSVAVSVQPDVLIVDEALAVGDVFFVQKCMRFMRRFREDHCLVFVSHDMMAVMSICDKAILLDHGCVKAAGAAKDVCELYLEEQYGETQNVAGIESGGDAPSRVSLPGHPQSDEELDVIDQRLKYINASPYRNDIELFDFDTSSEAFGTGEAVITSVRLTDPILGAALSWVVGGERVSLEICARTGRRLESPILGFMLRDRLGQILFSDNTYLTYRGSGFLVEEGREFRSRFTFRMPILPAGDYVISVSVADGTQSDHVQLHWLHDALAFRSHSSSVCTGLVGIPMMHVVMEQLEEASYD
jgi:lipopolysaccharide transport system ATP-binding protein